MSTSSKLGSKRPRQRSEKQRRSVTVPEDRTNARYRQGNDNAKAAGRDLPFSLADVENRRTQLSRRRRSLQESNAKAVQARVAYQSQIAGEHTSVARLRADLRDAEFDLDRTTVRAP